MALLMKLHAWIGPQTQGASNSTCEFVFFLLCLLVNVNCSMFLLSVVEISSIKLIDLYNNSVYYSSSVSYPEFCVLHSVPVLELCAVCSIVTVVLQFEQYLVFPKIMFLTGSWLLVQRI
jgi:hypothetical protein